MVVMLDNVTLIEYMHNSPYTMFLKHTLDSTYIQSNAGYSSASTSEKLSILKFNLSSRIYELLQYNF